MELTLQQRDEMSSSRFARLRSLVFRTSRTLSLTRHFARHRFEGMFNQAEEKNGRKGTNLALASRTSERGDKSQDALTRKSDRPLAIPRSSPVRPAKQKRARGIHPPSFPSPRVGKDERGKADKGGNMNEEGMNEEEYRLSSTSWVSELFKKKKKKKKKKGENKFKAFNVNTVDTSKKSIGLDPGPLAVNNNKEKKQRTVKNAAKSSMQSASEECADDPHKGGSSAPSSTSLAASHLHNSNEAKINQLLIIIVEKQEEFRSAIGHTRNTLQTELELLRSELNFLETSSNVPFANKPSINFDSFDSSSAQSGTSSSAPLAKEGERKFKAFNANIVEVFEKNTGLDSGPLAVSNNKEKKQRAVKKADREASEATTPDIYKHADKKKGNILSSEEEKNFEEGIFQLLTENWQFHGRLCNDLSKLTSIRVHPSKERRKQIFDRLAKKGAIVWGRRRKNDNVMFELDDITSFEGFQAAWYLKLGTGVEKPDKPSI